MKVHQVRAPNPGLFTGLGTNSWVVASGGEAIIIDPGPVIDTHLDAIREIVSGYRVAAILVTHTHPDHCPAANPLAEEFGVPAYGHSPGPAFKPDVRMTDGDRVAFGDTEAIAVSTPGHTPDHLCYQVDRVLFSGDHIVGHSTVVVEDMVDYLESLDRLASLELDKMYPGHGPILDDPTGIVGRYKEHRLRREQEIVAALGEGASTVGEIVHLVYADVDAALHFAAAQSTGAHLRKLVDEGRVELPEGAAEWTSPVELVRGSGG